MTSGDDRTRDEPVQDARSTAAARSSRPARIDPPSTTPRLTRRTGRAAAAAASTPADAPGAASGRPVALRLARLHLRLGQLPLARAQLEAIAGRGALDEPALLDLAEARWRTGDLAGAGEAATALLAHGRDDALALLIAAEAVAAEGRPGEARRLASRALALAEGPLDPIFAGMPRSPIWPEDAATPVEPHLERAARTRLVPTSADPETPASAAAAEAFAGGRAALAGGNVGIAALRLGVALRLDPGFADGVLEAVGAWERDPVLALVAGDAMRLLGREAEALVAFDLARGHA